MESFHYSSNLPYPPVCVEKVNPVYAQAMLDNIGGNNSEMSAISLYFYNNLITYNYEEVAEIFHKISMVEMRHLEIFGQLTLQLGENPRLWTHRQNHMVYWSPAYNKYPIKLSSLLVNAIHGEKAAIEKYEFQAQKIKDMNIVENLHRIILDEQLHVDIMTKLYQKYANCR